MVMTTAASKVIGTSLALLALITTGLRGFYEWHRGSVVGAVTCAAIVAAIVGTYIAKVIYIARGGR